MPRAELNVIATVTDQASSQLQRLRGEVWMLSRVADQGAGGLTRYDVAMSGLMAGGMLSAFGLAVAGIAKAGVQFNNEVLKVINNTTVLQGRMGQADAIIARVGDTALTMSAKFGAAADQVALGWMHAYNFVNDMDIAEIVTNIGTKSAVANFASVENTVNILATTMHAYALDVMKAGTATQNLADVQMNALVTMGQMDRAAAAGNMTVEQFNQAAGRSIAVGANLRIGLAQVSAGFVALTKHGFSAAQAQTQMTNLMQRLANPTKAALDNIKALSSASGVNLVKVFSATYLATKGLVNSSGTGALQMIYRAYRNMGYTAAEATQASYKLINAQRGGQALAVLLGTGWNDYNDALTMLSDREAMAAVNQEQFNEVIERSGWQLDKFTTTVTDTGIALGEGMQPAIVAVMKPINSVMDAIFGWVNANKVLAGTITMVVGIAAGVVGLFMTVGATIMLVQPILKSAGAAWGYLTGAMSGFAREGMDVSASASAIGSSGGRMAGALRLAGSAMSVSGRATQILGVSLGTLSGMVGAVGAAFRGLGSSTGAVSGIFGRIGAMAGSLSKVLGSASTSLWKFASAQSKATDSAVRSAEATAKANIAREAGYRREAEQIARAMAIKDQASARFTRQAEAEIVAQERVAAAVESQVQAIVRTDVAKKEAFDREVARVSKQIQLIEGMDAQYRKQAERQIVAEERTAAAYERQVQATMRAMVATDSQATATVRASGPLMGMTEVLVRMNEATLALVEALLAIPKAMYPISPVADRISKAMNIVAETFLKTQTIMGAGVPSMAGAAAATGEVTAATQAATQAAATSVSPLRAAAEARVNEARAAREQAIADRMAQIEAETTAETTRIQNAAFREAEAIERRSAVAKADLTAVTRQQVVAENATTKAARDSTIATRADAMASESAALSESRLTTATAQVAEAHVVEARTIRLAAESARQAAVPMMVLGAAARGLAIALRLASIGFGILRTAMSLMSAAASLAGKALSFVGSVISAIAKTAYAAASAVVRFASAQISASRTARQYALAQEQANLAMAETQVVAGKSMGLFGTLGSLLGKLMGPLLTVLLFAPMIADAYNSNFLGIKSIMDNIFGTKAPETGPDLSKMSKKEREAYLAAQKQQETDHKKWLASEAKLDEQAAKDPLGAFAIERAWIKVKRSIDDVIGPNAPIRGAWDWIKVAGDKALPFVVKGFELLGSALSTVRGWILGFVTSLAPIVESAWSTIQKIVEPIGWLIDVVTDPKALTQQTKLGTWLAGFFSVDEAFGIVTFLSNLGSTINTVAGYFDHVAKGGSIFNSFLVDMPPVVRETATALGAFFKIAQNTFDNIGKLLRGEISIDEFFSRMGKVIIKYAPVIWEMIGRVFALIPWGRIWELVQKAALAAFGWALDIGGKIWNWISRTFQAIDWDAVWNFVSTIASNTFKWVVGAGKTIFDWLVGLWNGIEWGKVWTALKTAAEDTFVWGFVAYRKIEKWLSDQFSGVSWSNVWDSVKIAANWASGLWDKLFSAGFPTETKRKMGGVQLDAGDTEIVDEGIGHRILVWFQGIWPTPEQWSGIWGKVQETAKSAFAWTLDIVGDLTDWATMQFSSIDWGRVTSEVGGFISQLWGALFAPMEITEKKKVSGIQVDASDVEMIGGGLVTRLLDKFNVWLNDFAVRVSSDPAALPNAKAAGNSLMAAIAGSIESPAQGTPTAVLLLNIGTSMGVAFVTGMIDYLNSREAADNLAAASTRLMINLVLGPKNQSWLEQGFRYSLAMQMFPSMSGLIAQIINERMEGKYGRVSGAYTVPENGSTPISPPLSGWDRSSVNPYVTQPTPESTNESIMPSKPSRMLIPFEPIVIQNIPAAAQTPVAGSVYNPITGEREAGSTPTFPPAVSMGPIYPAVITQPTTTTTEQPAQLNIQITQTFNADVSVGNAEQWKSELIQSIRSALGPYLYLFGGAGALPA